MALKPHTRYMLSASFKAHKIESRVSKSPPKPKSGRCHPREVTQKQMPDQLSHATDQVAAFCGSSHPLYCTSLQDNDTS